MIYTLVSNLEEARSIARTLVTEKLASCVNMLPHIESIYEWKDRIEESNEVALFIKCNPVQQENLLERLKQIHPYESPAIVIIKSELHHD